MSDKELMSRIYEELTKFKSSPIKQKLGKRFDRHFTK